MLSRRNDMTVRQGLAKGVGDASVEVRRVAATALAKEPQPTDWPALCRAMLDDEKSVRAPALESAALNRALAQDVPEISDLVVAARTKIETASGKKLPPAKPDLGDFSSEDAFEIPRGLPPGDNAAAEIKEGKLPDNAVAFVTLVDALVRPEDPAMRKPLDLELTRSKGAWEATVVGSGRKYNQGFHVGTLEETAGGRLRIEMQVGDDPWVTGGFGEYEIDLNVGSGDLTGSYEGRYNYHGVLGELTGRLLPLRPPIASDVPPLESGEHPRLVFRRGEIPAMRRRAQTAIGRAIGRAIRDRSESSGGLDGAVGCGFLYALYGDEPMGRRAVPALIAAARRTGFAHLHERAYDLNTASIAYDLAYDCLTDEEREEVTTYLAKMQGIVVPSVGMTGNFNNGPNSNWTAIGLGGTGLVSLATLKEQGPLVAVVDELEGGGEKTWVMHSGGKSTSVSGDQFTITGESPDTSLHGRLVAFDGIRLETGPVIWNQHNREFDKAQKNPPLGGLKDVQLKQEEIPERIDFPWGSETTLDPDNSLWCLYFKGLVPPKEGQSDRRDLNFYLLFREGRIVHAVGSALHWNKSCHAVDVSKLICVDDRLGGTIGITFHKDGHVPEDGRPIPSRLSVTAVLDRDDPGADEAIEGSYQGTFGEHEVSGRCRRFPPATGCGRRRGSGTPARSDRRPRRPARPTPPAPSRPRRVA